MNTSIQMKDIPKYKLQKYRNKNHRDTEIQNE